MFRFASAAPLRALLLAGLILAACETAAPLTPVPTASPEWMETRFPPTPCADCAQATAVALLTQEGINASARQAEARATAEIMGAQALATTIAGTSTQGAALAQAEIQANAQRAQAAATADIVRADALATANAARATQDSALTQVAELEAQARARLQATADAATQSALQAQVRLQLTEAAATRSAGATGTQQHNNAILAGTGTALARAMAQQTQAAAAIGQRLADQREAQQQGPSVWLWTWGLPILVFIAGGVGLWGFWRWLRQKTRRPPVNPPPFARPLIIPERRGGRAERRAPAEIVIAGRLVPMRPAPPEPEPDPNPPDDNAADADAPPPRSNVRLD